jgi:protein phosphatase
MRKLTKDHSYVQQLLDEGKISKEEAIVHPKKNMLLKALGCTEEIEPDIIVKNFQKDDILVMCSDGLSNMLSEEDIKNIIKEDINVAAEGLVEKANDNGGLDNITVIVVK